MNVIFYNGDFISEKKINISHRNRAFNYGDGFFETIKVINSTKALTELDNLIDIKLF